MPELTHEEMCQLYYICFNGGNGEAVLRDLKNKFFNITSLSDDADPNKVLIQEGKRFVVIHILAMMEEFEINERNKMKPLEQENED